MKAGIISLLAAYVLSQFYRAFLAVLAPVLETEIGATPDDLSRATGLWFVVFALMQIPVGWALDKIGPRLTAGVLLGLAGGGGAVLFSMARGPAGVDGAMILIGIGCSPVLMASYYIFARAYPPAIFATLAGATIGFGSLGNLAGSLPMAWAVEALGWRTTMLGLGASTVIVSLAVLTLVKDPPRDETGEKGSLIDLLRIPALWPIFAIMFVNYAPSAGLRALWAGPYMEEVFGLDPVGIGSVTLVMGLAMIAGNFIYGPLDRVFRSRKAIVFTGNMSGAAALGMLAVFPAGSVVASTALLAAVGFFGSSFAVIVAHGRQFFPTRLLGRGVTLMNLFGIGGAGLAQMASGRVYDGLSPHGATSPYVGIFAFFMLAVVVGCLLYLRAPEHRH